MNGCGFPTKKSAIYPLKWEPKVSLPPQVVVEKYTCAYCFGQVTKGHEIGHDGEYQTEDGKVMNIKGDLDSKCTKMDNESLKNMDNMVLFNDLSEAPLLHNLRKRFYDDDIYTWVL